MATNYKLEWLKSNHLRPVYVLDEERSEEEPTAYIAIAGSGTGYLMLHPVDTVIENRFYGNRKVTYNNRGTLFPYSDVEIAADTVFGTKVAQARQILKKKFGEFKSEELQAEVDAKVAHRLGF